MSASSRKSAPVTKASRITAVSLGMFWCAVAQGAADPVDGLALSGPVHGDFHDLRTGAFLLAGQTDDRDESRPRTDDVPRLSTECQAAPLGLKGPAASCALGQIPALDARYRDVVGSAPGAGASVAAILSDVLTRLHFGGSDPGLASNRAQQGEREILLTNSDALVRATVRLSLGKGWPVLVYADMGAVDSALKWQSLAAIRTGRSVDVLGGWRHVTYHFSPGKGLDSLDFDGPFLGATLVW